MTAVGRILMCLAAMIASLMATDLSVIDPMNQLNIAEDINNKTEICNLLKQKKLSDYKIVYLLEGHDENNANYFKNKMISLEKKDIALNIKQFIISSSDVDNESFLLCLKTIKSQQMRISDSSKAEIDEILSELSADDKRIIIIFENAISNYLYNARIMASDDIVLKDNKDANPSNVKEILEHNEEQEPLKKAITNEEINKDTPNNNKTLGADENKINIHPQGLMGVSLSVVFILLLIVYYNLILQAGNFNDKFMKEKLPQGKEY